MLGTAALACHAAVRLTASAVRRGDFGWEDYFGPVVDAISNTDYYLVANDFTSYLDTQVCKLG